MSSQTAVVIGEALVDIVQPPTGRATATPGGSPLNVAITLARLGVETQLVTALGDDQQGDWIESHLARSGVRLAPGARALPATSSATAHLQTDGSARYEFDVAWDPQIQQLPPAAAVHVGSLALFLDPGAGTVAEHVRHASGRALVTPDPNVRPSLLPGPDRVRGKFEELVRLADVGRGANQKDGVLQQVDSPLALYHKPANLFVAGFLGLPAMNLLPAQPSGFGLGVVDGHWFAIDQAAAARARGDVTLGIRPESFRLVADGDEGYPVEVCLTEELGADAYLYANPVAKSNDEPSQAARRTCGPLGRPREGADCESHSPGRQDPRLRHRIGSTSVRLTACLINRSTFRR